MRTLALLAGLGVGAVALLAGGLVARAPSEPWQAPAVDVADLPVNAYVVAGAVSDFLKIDTQQPPGPNSWRTVRRAPDSEDTMPAWVAFLDKRYLTPLDLSWRMVAGALVIDVPSPDDRAPVVWLSHVDVVPIGDAAAWTHPPFAGTRADGFVWGRGAADNKAALITQLEALRAAEERGVVPSRDLVIVVTTDEEISGATAKTLAESHLAELGDPEVLIDEGSFVLPDFLPGATVGAVAVAEKTFVTYELTVPGRDGHSSMPDGDSALDQLTIALDRLRTWETPDRLPPPLIEAFKRLAPSRGFPESLALGNADLLSPVLLGIVQGTPAGNAVTRNTVAATVVDAGTKDNVLPYSARALVNARLLPDQDVEAFTAELVAQIGNPRIRVETLAWPAQATVTSHETDTFHAIEAALAWVDPATIVVPSQTPGTMDARFFSAAGLDTYRIHPFLMPSDERRRLHALDERISEDNLVRGVRFYWALMQQL
jgi:carboxypeptidase PM20D1